MRPVQGFLIILSLRSQVVEYIKSTQTEHARIYHLDGVKHYEYLNKLNKRIIDCIEQAQKPQQINGRS